MSLGSLLSRKSEFSQWENFLLGRKVNFRNIADS